MAAIGQPRYSKEEFARRGTELYEQQVQPLVEAGNHGKIVAIDIDTGAYEVAEGTLTAAHRLLARNPDAQIWFVRIRSPWSFPSWTAWQNEEGTGKSDIGNFQGKFPMSPFPSSIDIGMSTEMRPLFFDLLGLLGHAALLEFFAATARARVIATDLVGGLALAGRLQRAVGAAGHLLWQVWQGPAAVPHLVPVLAVAALETQPRF